MQDLRDSGGGPTSIIQQMQKGSVWVPDSDEEYFGALIDAVRSSRNNLNVSFDV